MHSRHCNQKTIKGIQKQKQANETKMDYVFVSLNQNYNVAEDIISRKDLWQKAEQTFCKI